MAKFLRLMGPLGLILLLGLTGCTEPNAAHSDDETGGWLDGDASLGDVEGSLDVGLLPDVSGGDTSVADAQQSDSSGLQDTISPDPDGSASDAAPIDVRPDDIGVADVGRPDTDIPSPDIIEADVLEPGDECSTNSQCGPGVVCCNEGFSGARVCKVEDECRFGGFCEAASECGDGQGCCEVGGQNMKMCSERCFDSGGGGSETSCQSNGDCTGQGEVCCPGLGGGGGTCETSCQLGGGLCTEDSQCSGNDRCCRLAGQGLCLSPDLPIPCQ